MAATVTKQISTSKAIELPDEFLEHLGVRPGDRVDVAVTGPGRVEIRRALEPLPLAELFDRYQINRPVDWNVLQEEIEEDMARDALRGFER